MGRLVGLELHNFKSYRGTSQIGFGTSCFTSIIGPNGAGKSNMMDAISFVLGIKSSQLRSQNMKDLIYRGRVEETELFDASLDAIDVVSGPSSAYVSAIYEKDDGEKLEFKRVITSNGSTDYKINNKSVTANNYASVLKIENILVKAKNFLVFQGDVESIASQTSKDLTRLIENVSGSVELSKEYDELKDELDQAHEFSNSVFARKRNLNSESKQYKEQMAEQEIFEAKLTEKSDLIKIAKLYKLYHNEKKHVQMKQELNSKFTELKNMKRELIKEEAEYKKLVSKYSADSLNVSSFNDHLDTLKAETDKKKAEIMPLGLNQKAISSKINNNKLKIKDLSSEITKKAAMIKSLETQLKEIKRSFKKFEDRISASISSSNLTVEDHQEYERLKGEYLSNGGSELEEQLSLLLNEKENIMHTIENNQEQISTLKTIISDLNFTKTSELGLRLSSTTSEISESLALKNERTTKRNSLIEQQEQLNHTELKLNAQLRDVLVKLEDLSSKQRESNKYKRQREVVSTLKNLLPENSVKGFVYELIRPTHKKYDTALITLLGSNFDSIIVETKAIAYKCIEILKERRLGVATFIPLDSISNDVINLNFLRSLHSKAQPGVDIVDIEDKSLENAFNYVVGNALVVDDMNVARELKWGPRCLDNKIVTLQGSTINRSGLMTGGLNTERYENITWDKNEIKSLTEMKDDLLNELAVVNAKKPKEMEINLINESIASLDDRLPLLRNQKDSIERAIKDKEAEIEYNNESIKSLEEAISKRRDQQKQIDTTIYQLNKEVDNIQNDIFADFCQTHRIKGGVRTYEEVHGAALRTKTKERAQFNKVIATLENKIRFDTESLDQLQTRKHNLERVVTELEAKLQDLLDTKDEFDNELDELEARYEATLQEKAIKDEALKRDMKFIAHIEGNIKDLKSELETAAKAISINEESVLKVDIERVNILKNTKIENVIIPLLEGALDQISLNESVDKSTRQIYNIKIDYDMLNNNLRASYNIRAEAELQAKLTDVIEQLDKLTPNARAAERLRETETRLHDFDKDFSKARQRENRALTKFNEIKAQRFELFTKAFDHISNKIDEIYKELTRTSVSPIGGSAYLTLENEDEPYLHGIKYHAMPPMKRFRDMELLSGGEKTMAALALLFAIHSFQPSPFFVLDEVDAALDAANVNKIANYIKKISSPSFQFIVISLKSALFEKSDALVGIYREQRENSSRTMTLDLRDYPEESPLVMA